MFHCRLNPRIRYIPKDFRSGYFQKIRLTAVEDFKAQNVSTLQCFCSSVNVLLNLYSNEREIDGVKIEGLNMLQGRKSFWHMSKREKNMREKIESAGPILFESFEEDFERGSVAFWIRNHVVKMAWEERFGQGVRLDG